MRWPTVREHADQNSSDLTTMALRVYWIPLCSNFTPRPEVVSVTQKYQFGIDHEHLYPGIWKHTEAYVYDKN